MLDVLYIENSQDSGSWAVINTSLINGPSHPKSNLFSMKFVGTMGFAFKFYRFSNTNWCFD